MSFFSFVAVMVILFILFLMLILFAFGCMHQHLKNKGEAFGSAPSKADFDALHQKLQEVDNHLQIVNDNVRNQE